MKIFEYHNKIFERCPVCKKVIINNDLEKGEVSKIKHCKHLLFALIQNETIANFVYAKSKIDANRTLNEKDLRQINQDPNRILHKVYENPDSYWYFLFSK